MNKFINSFFLFSWMYNLLGEIQTCPLFLNFAEIAISVALFISASSKTINGEWPLSSIVTLCTFSAACFKINFPTLVEPVIEIFLIISDEINCSAILGGSPDNRFTTPAGTPHSLQISTNSITVPGVIVSGLIITEQPAAKDVEIFLEDKTNGKFHGVKAATTPTGW